MSLLDITFKWFQKLFKLDLNQFEVCVFFSYYFGSYLCNQCHIQRSHLIFNFQVFNTLQETLNKRSKEIFDESVNCIRKKFNLTDFEPFFMYKVTWSQVTISGNDENYNFVSDQLNIYCPAK